MKKLIYYIVFLVFTNPVIGQDYWLPIEKPNSGKVHSLQTIGKQEIYIGTGDEGVFKSIDKGLSWVQYGLAGRTVYSMLFCQEEIMYAGTGGGLYRREPGDNGWSHVFSVMNNVISILHSSDDCLFIGSWGGIYKSCDNGVTWTQTIEISNCGGFKKIIEAPNGFMYAACTEFCEVGGVYRSTDNGDSWQLIGLYDYYIWDVNVDSQGNLYAGSVGNIGTGIYKSTDNGESWVCLRYDVFVANIVITPDDVIYIGCTNEHGTQGGVFRSFDGGNSWEMINSGLTGSQEQCVYGLTMSPDGYLYAYGFTIHRSAEQVFDPVYNITASASPLEGGMVTGAGEYDFGDTIMLEAIAEEGYTFVNWTEGNRIVSQLASYEFAVNRHRVLKANFLFDASTVTVSSNPPEGGTVIGGGVFENGSLIELRARPNVGYGFVNWTEDGQVLSTDTILSFNLSEDRSLTANFTINTYSLSLAANPAEGGTVSGGGVFEHGTATTVQATPNEGYSFVNWTEEGEVLSTDSIFSFSLTANRSLTANFAINTYTLTLDVSPDGGGTVSGGGMYGYGTTVTAQAIPNQGYSFVNWTEGGEAISTDPVYNFTLTQDRSLTAHFAINTYSLTLAANPAEGGSVNGEGIYEHGTTVTINATPNEGYRFVNWTEDGAVVSTNPGFSFTINNQLSMVANFFKKTGLDDQDGNQGIQVYPNPFGTSITIDFSGTGIAAGQAYITIYDAQGALVLKLNSRHKQQLDIPLPGIPAGLYYLIIDADGKRVSKQMIKMK